MPAAVFQSVANQVSQLSQPRTTLRQCDSCPYPFRDRAPTVALTREGCWSKKQTVANQQRTANLARGVGRFLSSLGPRTGWVQNLPQSQIDVLRWSICKVHSS